MAREKSLKILESESSTILERDAEFEGKLTFEGTVQINGKFNGEIFSDGMLIVGDGAEVKANIDVGVVIISGTVMGTIRAKQKIEMVDHARVFGDIFSPALAVSEGAIFEGHCSMGTLRETLHDNNDADVIKFNTTDHLYSQQEF